MSARWGMVRAWLSDWGNALCVLLWVYAASYIWWQWSAPPSMLRNIIAKLAVLPFNAGCAALALRAASRPTTDHRIRRTLKCFGAGFLCVLIGNIIAFYVGFVRNDDPLVSWINVIYFAFYFLALAGLLSLPLARRVHNEYWKFFLDASTVVLGGGIAIWYLVIRPTEQTMPESTSGLIIALAYPVCSLLLILGVVTVLLRRPSESHRTAARLLIAGLGIYLASDLINDIAVLQVGFLGFSPFDLAFMVAYCILLLSFRKYYAEPPEIPPPSDLPDSAQPFSPLPYAAVAVSYALLLALAVRDWPSPFSVLTVGAVVITALIVIRQIGAVRENVRLNRQRVARETEARFSALVQHSSDVIAIADPDAVFSYISPSVARVFGYEPEDLLSAKATELVHPDDLPKMRQFLADAAAAPVMTAPVELRVRHSDGSWRHVETVATNLLDEPTVRGIVINTRDISERRMLQDQLTFQAFHDQLTKLANRALFLDRVAHALTLARRHRQTLAVIFLDLDNFKTVNDSLGHAAGDRLLTITAQRLLTCVRTSDTVARFGGDEFAILLEDAVDENAATAVVERIVDALRYPFQIDAKEVYVTASIGIAAAGASETAADLVRNADMAMYIAKSRGKGRYEVFETRMHEEAVERLELEADLRRALDREEFHILYQPIVLLQTGEITGVEALVRWQHPRRGMLSPMQFIPLAEETGLIVPLGSWVVREACRQATGWQALRLSASPLTLTINISGHQLQGESVVDDVRAALDDSGLDPHLLVLEITESVLMQQSETILQRLRALKALGVRLAIDDFGTGYSSLGYLQRFPIDILKIDKAFVDDVGRNGSEPALARAVIALGETLRLQTIAEGIEEKHQLSGLQELGCELGQGFLFAKPISASAIESMLVRGPGKAVPPYGSLVARETVGAE
ncbi:MAG TPA: EAL domain-containing protein [Gemmatimonadaceae bacterium]|nr:EAL domain-containing protein [Gemmatimonadaceae bacterium]